MSESPQSPSELFSRIHGFMAAMESGQVTAEERDEFESLICDSPQACDLFIRYRVTTSNLRAWASEASLESDEDVRIARLFSTDIAAEESQAVATTQRSRTPSTPQLPVIITSPEETWHGVRGFFSQEVPFAYMVSTFVMIIFLLVAWQWKVPIYVQVATSPSSSTSSTSSSSSISSSGPAADRKITSIGRITGMVDCRWKKKGLGTRDWRPGRDRKGTNQKYLVAIDDKFALASGLLEITYDSGAKVILQGPCTYEVESGTGGYLSLGKLTAKLEKRSEVGGQRSEVIASSPRPFDGRGAGGEGGGDTNPSLSTLHSPLFTIKTPTATVTDLGTEFGVLVSEKGLTEVHVLQGVVDAQIAGLAGEPLCNQRVLEGCAVRIQPKSERIEEVAFAPQPFTRKLEVAPETPAEQAYSKAVLADKPLGYWPLNEPANVRKFSDRSGNNFHGYAMQKVVAGQPGPLSDGSRAVALDGDGYIDFGLRNEFAMQNDFTFEAWIWIGRVEQCSHAISVLGREGQSHIGWGLIAGRDRPDTTDSAENPVVLYFIAYEVGHFHFPLAKDEPIEDRWIHVAVVFDRDNTAQFYLNGKHRGSVTKDRPVSVGPVWLQIGCAELVDVDFWRGRLAHVAVYPRALDAEQIQTHYRLRSDGGKEAADQQR